MREESDPFPVLSDFSFTKVNERLLGRNGFVSNGIQIPVNVDLKPKALQSLCNIWISQCSNISNHFARLKRV